jgi:hypothetical protein
MPPGKFRTALNAITPFFTARYSNKDTHYL